MRSIKIEIHPLSAALGTVVAVAVLITLSAAQLPVAATQVQWVAIAGPVSVDGIPHAGQLVAVQGDGGSLVVPQGKLFVPVSLGRANVSVQASGVMNVLVNGVIELTRPEVAIGSQAITGLAFAAGDLVLVSAPNAGNSARLWGYLVDA